MGKLYFLPLLLQAMDTIRIFDFEAPELESGKFSATIP